MSLAAGALTALGEAAYFTVALGAPFGLVLMADFSLETGLRPAWVVLVSTAALALLGALRPLVRRLAKARLRTA